MIFQSNQKVPNHAIQLKTASILQENDEILINGMFVTPKSPDIQTPNCRGIFIYHS